MVDIERFLIDNDLADLMYQAAGMISVAEDHALKHELVVRLRREALRDVTHNKVFDMELRFDPPPRNDVLDNAKLVGAAAGFLREDAPTQLDPEEFEETADHLIEHLWPDLSQSRQEKAQADVAKALRYALLHWEEIRSRADGLIEANRSMIPEDLTDQRIFTHD